MRRTNIRSLFLFSVWLTLGNLAFPQSASAQSERQTAPDEGIRFQPPTTVALVNAHVVVSAQREFPTGTVVLKNGRIAAVGADVQPPAGAEVIDCHGDYLYPAFIDAFVEFESKADEAQGGSWNEQITPQRRMAKLVDLPAAKLEGLRKAGIAVALAAPSGGLIKGQSCVVLTSDGTLQTQLLAEDNFQHLRLYPSRRSREYPNSPMGALALIRQSLSDAIWYQRAQQAAETQSALAGPESNLALVSLQPAVTGRQRLLVDGTNELYALRADRLAREFSLGLVIRGSGREYRRLEAVAATGRTFIIPVNFPKAPEVASQQEIADATLEELMHWNLAPSNPARLDSVGIEFVLSSDGSDAKDFLENIRKAVKHGLSEEAALSALTVGPARLLGIDAIAGTIERGKLANILRTDGKLFDAKTKLKTTWVDGWRYVWTDDSQRDLTGIWKLEIDHPELPELHLQVTGKPDKPEAKIGLPGSFDKPPPKSEDDEQPDGKAEEKNEEKAAGDAKETSTTAKVAKLAVTEYHLDGTFSTKELRADASGVAAISAAILVKEDEAHLVGTIQWPDGSQSDFVARLMEEAAVPESAGQEASESDKPTEESDSTEGDKESEGQAKDAKQENETQAEEQPSSEAFVCDVIYPLGAYGLSAPPPQPEYVLVRGATIWTCSELGILESADLLVHQGIIEEVGQGLAVPEGAQVIDAAGMHVSPGIIDCHSHMATDGGVNESGQAVTAEVRIGDFIDPEDITIYRQLAGGVTSSNILHGSANPIGGQNQVIKLRWGGSGEEMKMAEAPAGIKFALGENVKQSNRSEAGTRYPQTRMGVEQIMRDRFEAAKLYRRRWHDWESNAAGLPPRKDYELEAIAEILEGTRWVHCHSYRQDEILAMLRTLEDYDVTIGSLQHILEGYKVADAMAAHGATGSSFSDWWAYKFEVYDAIPYNGALMHRQGVIVSFNSDDRELARHLNHEAAKAVKYGGVSPEEALKFVTLNPAKQLRIDPWVGSLDKGKQADFVIWNRSPLSTLSACMQTWVDGKKYFDRAEDLLRREKDAELHRKLVQLIIDSDAKTGKRSDDNPSYWWARYDEFCHHGHEEDEHDAHE